MTDDALLGRVMTVVCRTAGPTRMPPNPGPHTPLGNGGFWLDSVDLVELIVACEAEFSVTFEGEMDLTEESLGTLGSLTDLIRTKNPR